MKTKEYNQSIMLKNKKELRELEKNYVEEVLGDINKAIENKRKEIEKKLIEYSETHKVKKRTKDGVEYEVANVNPIVIQKYFFKSISPMMNIEPAYNAEKLGIVWGLYEEMIEKISTDIGVIAPSLSGFCSFAGIRVSTFKEYRKSVDIDMRVVSEKIEDSCFDSNTTLAQFGYIKERTTVYRMKSEQERVEKEMPTVHIHNNNGVDLEQINKRLEQLGNFADKKSFIEAKKVK